ncbi:hypothetical protein ES703_80012 [subsurface metagenome]
MKCIGNTMEHFMQNSLPHVFFRPAMVINPYRSSPIVNLTPKGFSLINIHIRRFINVDEFIGHAENIDLLCSLQVFLLSTLGAPLKAFSALIA